MSDPFIEIAREASKLSGLLPKIYDDLAKPGARQVGKALETVLGLGNTILWPMAWANARAKIALERNLERYRESMASTPLEEVIPVPPELGVPIAEKLAYVRDPSLAELYIRLLNTASNSKTVHRAHPSFVNVINNLAPDEARLLEFLRKNHNLPFLHAIASDTEDRSFVSLEDFILPQRVTALFDFSTNIAVYLSNATGLGLIDVKRGSALRNTKEYETMMDDKRGMLEHYMQKHRNLKRHVLKYEKGIITVTEYGHLFLLACSIGES